jgi:hypothetical protein|tara:strand:- start:592 stop:744 length:153 start_codon:yes stop_codon:yes gene_type:complete
MIIIKLLNIDNFYGLDETIEISKGKNKLPETLKEGFKQIKRHMKWQKNIH